MYVYDLYRIIGRDFFLLCILDNETMDHILTGTNLYIAFFTQISQTFCLSKFFFTNSEFGGRVVKYKIVR